ncbi:hypothetical protein B0J12DRAFT_703941 [Macrophomina phaseolina]|uniref:Short-chain dehydrogenase/reductase SDR n=1 Tax=Macrophomina phaseolina TaxID=35725 RepID=A0ABQ8FWZ3_9PEZI|nr:hypothetical protein B0J12DRAFT_703941 [Macrophomina phaseolina]
MASYFVTGSSRGIGLGIVQSLAQAPAADVGKVFVSARTETPALTNLVSDSAGRVESISLDVTSEKIVRKAVQTVERSLGGQAFDVLINNAGIMNHTPKGGENMTDLIETFNINVVVDVPGWDYQERDLYGGSERPW